MSGLEPSLLCFRDLFSLLVFVIFWGGVMRSWVLEWVGDGSVGGWVDQ